MDDVELKRELPEAERWEKEVHLALKRDKLFLKDGKDIYARYRNELRITSGNEDKKPDMFNILWANTETLRPALYSRTPRPDIRRRFKNETSVGRHVVELLERAAVYTFEASSFNDYMICSVLDMLLPGRGVIRPRYKAHFSEDEQIQYEEVIYESIDWDCLLLGPAEKWEDLEWMAFKHKLSKEQMEELAPEFAERVQYQISAGDDDNKTGKEKEAETRSYARAVVWEIWDKDSREVKWFAEGYTDSLIRLDEDPLNLHDFWPIPKPLYAIEDSTSLVPVPTFRQYEILANQLEDVTNRMGRITKALRVRGVYDSTMSELHKLFDAADNDMIPAEGITRILERGGIDKGIWMFPNQTLAEVLMQLWQYRAQTIQQIYELTGISDILRGSSNPHETLGAQKIKANFGAQRLSRLQAEVQRYARDVLRLTVELIAEKFSPETLTKMTGLRFPTMEEKQQIEQQKQQYQMMAQQAQQMQQEPPPPPEGAEEMMAFAQLPTWDEIQQVMHSDLLREYQVDIETDSTIEADQQADQESLAALIQGISQYAHGVGPIIESGVMSKEAAKKVLVAMFRRYRLGREVEEAIEESPPEQQEDPAQQAEQQKMQAEQQKMQMEMQKLQVQIQAAQQEAQMRQQEMQQESQQKMAELQMEMQQAQAEHQQKMTEVQMQMQRDREKHQFEMARLSAQQRAVNE